MKKKACKDIRNIKILITSIFSISALGILFSNSSKYLKTAKNNFNIWNIFSKYLKYIKPWSGWPRTYKTTSGEHLVTLTSGQSVDDGLACARSFSNLKNKQKNKIKNPFHWNLFYIYLFFGLCLFFWIVSREDRKLERKRGKEMQQRATGQLEPCLLRSSHVACGCLLTALS